jgi:Xaa-Pro aminopeptidase
VAAVIADRSLPLIYADAIRQVGIEVTCDREMGVVDRRSKDEQEIACLREAQRVTEEAIQMACRIVAGARASADGTLTHEGSPLTSERLREAVDVFLLGRGFTNPSSIIACGPEGADCHNLGSGVFRTGQPVIIDIFPRSRATLYNGDCTRTVVHGEISDELLKMHRAVVAAKAAATAATRPGVTGQQVHEATVATIREFGFQVGLPKDTDPDTYCALTHGTGHGIGLDVHEPPLLDRGGPPLVVGDALTIEPGLYCRAIGGIRVEDMVVVTADGCENLNSLPEGLDWS